MNSFSRKGSAIAGLVGVLSLVLMVGVVGITAYSALNTTTSTQTGATKKFSENANFELRVYAFSKTDSGYSILTEWSFVPKSDPSAKLSVSIRERFNGKAVKNGEEKLLEINVKSRQFQNIVLSAGKTYYAQLQYIPSSGSVLVQKVVFFKDSEFVKN